MIDWGTGAHEYPLLSRACGAAHQSISQLALKPGKEEIKKKCWWQFWK